MAFADVWQLAVRVQTARQENIIYTGHLTGWDGADPHNSLTSASSASSEHFPHKTEKKMPNISAKSAAFHPHKHKIRRD